ncbi:hypothetical protein Y032_0031g2281 [Ancylostoma ceylanicum]|uniref:Uncharacterized protein n=1 Tax=Ancylostoma ceylanicum TaxID=53326 RepID=A0A016URJ6_9BILA|nr:hypothetical protein Y032_0031g2281 [Ancylostoma ceylanicum]
MSVPYSSDLSLSTVISYAGKDSELYHIQFEKLDRSGRASSVKLAEKVHDSHLRGIETEKASQRNLFIRDMANRATLLTNHLFIRHNRCLGLILRALLLRFAQQLPPPAVEVNQQSRRGLQMNSNDLEPHA